MQEFHDISNEGPMNSKFVYCNGLVEISNDAEVPDFPAFVTNSSLFNFMSSRNLRDVVFDFLGICNEQFFPYLYDIM